VLAQAQRCLSFGRKAGDGTKRAFLHGLNSPR
jgi:hypothetical protein